MESEEGAVSDAELAVRVGGEGEGGGEGAVGGGEGEQVGVAG